MWGKTVLAVLCLAGIASALRATRPTTMNHAHFFNYMKAVNFEVNNAAIKGVITHPEWADAASKIRDLLLWADDRNNVLAAASIIEGKLAEVDAALAPIASKLPA